MLEEDRAGGPHLTTTHRGAAFLASFARSGAFQSTFPSSGLIFIGVHDNCRNKGGVRKSVQRSSYSGVGSIAPHTFANGVNMWATRPPPLLCATSCRGLPPISAAGARPTSVPTGLGVSQFFRRSLYANTPSISKSPSTLTTKANPCALLSLDATNIARITAHTPRNMHKYAPAFPRRLRWTAVWSVRIRTWGT